MNKAFIKSKAMFVALLLMVGTIDGFAQTLGDYRSTIAVMDWSNANQWETWDGDSWEIATSYPGQNSGTGTVTISTGHTVSINVAPANPIGSLLVNSSAILQYESLNARTLIVSEMVTVNSGGTFRSALSGNITTHQLITNGSIANNGTIDFSTNSNNAGVGITFTGDVNNEAFDLRGAILTNLRSVNGVVLDKGNNVLSFLPGGQFLVLSANAVGFLTIQSGTFSLMGVNSFSNPLFYASTGSYSIPSGGGFTLNNPNATISGIYGTLTNNGQLTIRDGVFNVGDGTGNESLTTSTGRFEMSGGVMNISGRFRIDGGNCIINGGELNLATIGHANRTLAAFHISGSANLTISGNPLITFAFPNSNTIPFNDIEIVAGSGAKTITGGTFQLGTSATTTDRTFLVNSDIPIYNIVVFNNHTRVSLADNLIVNNQLTLNGRLLMNNYDLNIGAPVISGTFGANAGMIVTGLGTGEVHKTVNALGSYIFPFSNGSAYLPVTLGFTNGIFSSDATVSVRMIDDIHPENANTTNYLTRYWTVRTTGITNPVYNFTGTYTSGDVIGQEGWMTTGIFTTFWTKLTASGNIGTTIQAKGLTGNLDITGINSAMAPTVTTTALPAMVCSGSPAQLTATATGDAPFTYLWTPAVGLSATSIANPVATPITNTTYTVTVTDRMGGSATASATVTVNPLPTATISGSRDVCQNTVSPNVTFTGASGTAPYTFAYRINDGADRTITTTTGNIAIVAVPTGSEGNFVYSLVSVQDTHCSQSQAGTATITINPLPQATATSNSPQCVGSTLTLTASGGTFYRWTGPNNFTSFLPNPSIATITSAAAGTYTVTVTDANGCEATASTSVVINPAPTVSITASPGGTICKGTNVTFISKVTNSGPNPSYQWRINESPVSGQTNSTFSTTALTNTQRVMVVVTADPAYCSSTATSNVITMTVNDPITPTVSILESRNNVCTGTSVTFTSVVANGGSSPTYQWQINGTDVPAATSSTFSSSTLNDGDQVRVIVTSNATCVSSSTATSREVTMTVNPVVTPSVSIAANPSTPVCPGTAITFTATPGNGGSNPVYQWFINNNPEGSGGPIFTSSTLANNDVVSVRMTSNASCVSQAIANSTNMTVTVNPGIPAVPAAITGNTVACPNSTETYTISQVLNATSYSWTVPTGWTIQNGQGTNTITFTSGTTGQNGSISVRAVNSCGTSGSRTLSVTTGNVSTAPAGIIITNNNTCLGTNKTLTVNGGSLGTGASWQWYTGSCGGTSAGTGASITVNPAAETIYYVRAVGTCNTTGCVSNTVIVSPGAPAQPLAITGGATPVCPAASLTYSVAAVANATSYNWTVPTGWTITSGIGTTSITVTTGSAGQNGNISVTAVNSCGSSTALTLAVTVSPGTPATPGSITGNSDVCINSTGRTYSIAAVPNATSYTWSIPSGWTITSGSGTNSITVSTNGTASSGTISIVAVNTCGTSPASTMPVYVVTTVPSTPGTINGLTAICPVKSVVYSITPVPGAISYTWTVPASWSISNGQTTSSITVQVPSTAQSGNVSVVANNVCGPSGSSSISVSVANTAWVNAGTDQVVCLGTRSVTLNGSVGGAISANKDKEWDWQSVNGGSILPADNLRATYTLPNDGNTAGVYTVRILSNVSAVGCVQTQDEMTVTVLPNPSATLIVTGTNPICSGSTSTITFTGTPNTTVAYTVSGVSGSSTINIGTSGTATLTTATLTAPTNTYTITNASYTAAPSCSITITGQTAVVNVNQTPTVNAGPTIVTCQSATPSAITLTGATVGGGATTGAWSIVSGGGTLSNTAQTANPATVTYTPAPNFSGSVTLMLTTNAPAGCTAVNATRTVTINPLAIIDAGANQTVCAFSPVTLAGIISGAVTSGTWSGGSGSFSNTGSLTTVYTPSEEEILDRTVTLTLTSDDPAGPCGPVSDQVTIAITPAATVNAGVDQDLCEGSPAILRGTIGGAAGSATWSGGAGAFSNPASLTTTYIPANGETGDVTLTLTTDDPSGSCNAASDQMVIHIYPRATVSAGSNQTICSNGTATMAGSFGGSATSGAWTTSGNGTFSNPTLPSAVYTPGNSDIFNGTVTLTYTTNDPIGPCGPASASMTLTINDAIQITSQPANTGVCATYPADLTVAAVGDNLTYQWYRGTAPNGTPLVNSANITGAQSAALHFSHATSADEGSYYVMISGATSCIPVTSNTVTLNVDQEITITHQFQSETVCVGDDVTFSIEAEPGGLLSFQWRKDGVYIPNATGNTYTLNDVTLANGGSYDVEIKGLAGYTCTNAKSAPATLTVTPSVEIPVFALGATSKLCQEAATVTYSATANHSTGITYGLDATTAAFAGNSINATTGAVTYAAGWSGVTTVTARATGCNGPATATHTVTITPTVTIAPYVASTSTRCQGAGIVTYSTTATNYTSLTYSLDAASVSGGNTINAATGAVNFAATWSGTTTITATAQGCNGPVTATHTVTITPTVKINAYSPLTSTRCQGAGTVTYSTTATNYTALTYSLDNASLTGDNSINASTGAVTFVAGWSGTTTITATATGCNGPATTAHTVTITPTVTIAPYVAPTSTRCQSAGTVTYSTTATNYTALTYSLDPASVSGGNTINAATGAVNFAATWSGTTIITATATGCNGPVTATHTVTVTPTVTIAPYVASTSTRCQGAGTVTYATTATNNSSAIVYSLDAASITGGNSINASTGAVTFAAGWSGTTTIIATANGCNGPVTATHRVTITPTVTITPFAALISNRCQAVGTVTYSTTASNTIGITYSLDPSSVSGGNSINASTGTVTFNANWSGVTTITASAAGCNGPAVATLIVTTDPVSLPGTVSPVTPVVCSGSNSGTLTLSGYVGTIVRWESSTNGGVTWNPIVNTGTTQNYSNLTQSTLYRAVVKSGSCSVVYSAFANVVVISPYSPTITTNPNPPVICIGQSATLMASSGPLDAPFIGSFGNANPEGWRVDGNLKDFPSAPANEQPGPWGRATNNRSYYGIDFFSSGGAFSVVNGPITSTLETPVFSLVGMTSAFYNTIQALRLANGASARIEISTDGGNTYNITLAQYTGPVSVGNNSGFTNSYWNLASFLGQTSLRIRYSFTGTVNSTWAIDDAIISATPGGNPYANLVTYTWSPSATLSSATGLTVTATPSVTTTYTLVASITAGGITCQIGTNQVAVTVIPLPVVTPVNACVGGGTVTFTQAEGPAGGTWRVSGGGTINASTGVFTPTTAGRFTVTYTTPQGNCSDTESFVVFPAAPVFTVPVNICAAALTLPAVPAVVGFNVEYSIDGGTYAAAPTTAAPGCHTIKARYVLAAAWGTNPAGTTASAACAESNTVNIIIFPPAPSAPVVNSGCGAITVTPPPVVSGFDIQYSFNDGVTWGTNTPPTADNCTGYNIITRYVTHDACGTQLAGAFSTVAGCDRSPATNRRIDTTIPVIATTAVNNANLGCNPTVTAPVFTVTELCDANPIAIVTTPGPTNTGCAYIQTWTASYTDACNNAATPVSRTYTWTQDLVAPVITCPVNGTVTVAVNSGSSYLHSGTAWDATATDNCSLASVNYSLSGATTIPTGDLTTLNNLAFKTGTTTVKWTATDACGNTSSCSFDVTVPGEADIAVVKTGPATIAAGETITYTLTVTNLGPAQANSVTLTDAVPAGITNAQYSADGGLTYQPWPGSLVYTNLFVGADHAQTILIRGVAACPTAANSTLSNTATVTLAGPLVDPVIANNSSTVVTSLSDAQPPTFTLINNTLRYCVSSILWAVYNPNPTVGIIPEYDDITTLRPEYYLFTAGNAIFDLDTIANNFNDNCCPDERLTLHWKIDFAPTPNPATVDHEMITQNPITDQEGQPSLYTQNIQFPGDGVTFKDVIHQLTYWLVDCNGNPSPEQHVQIIIQPRPSITKVY